LAEPVLAANVDRLILIGEDMAPLSEVLDGRVATDRAATVDEAGALLLSLLRAGDVVLVKASNSVGLAKLVDRVSGGVQPCST
jgi:UDP-N-acetylmuramoyl-tripeptide--D-alanyl-D-alanine ligase